MSWEGAELERSFRKCIGLGDRALNTKMEVWGLLVGCREKEMNAIHRNDLYYS